jgi:hypothetical protein
MSWAANVECVVEKRNSYKMWVGRPERKRPLGRLWHKWEDIIKINLSEIVWNVWTGLIWLTTVMNVRVLYTAGNYLIAWATISFSRTIA